MSSPNGNRRSRAEANEEAFKAHNERRAEIEERAGVWDDEPVPFTCECDNPACGRAIMMTVAMPRNGL